MKEQQVLLGYQSLCLPLPVLGTTLIDSYMNT